MIIRNVGEGMPPVARLTVLAKDPTAARNMEVAAARAGVTRFMRIPEANIVGGSLRYMAEQLQRAHREGSSGQNDDQIRDEAFAQVDKAYEAGGTLFSVWVELKPGMPDMFERTAERGAAQDELMAPFYQELDHVEGETGLAKRFTNIGRTLGMYSSQELVD